MQLLDAISLVERGFSATEDDKKRIDKLASKLEGMNPNKKSLEADEINGKWKLLYTTSQSILGQNRPFFLRPLGPIYQFIGALPASLLGFGYELTIFCAMFSHCICRWSSAQLVKRSSARKCAPPQHCTCTICKVSARPSN
jgi:hypothetical protein